MSADAETIAAEVLNWALRAPKEDENRSAAYWLAYKRVVTTVAGLPVRQNQGYVVRNSWGELVPALGLAEEGYEVYDEKKADAGILAREFDYVTYTLMFDIAVRYLETGCPMPLHLRAFTALILEQLADNAQHLFKHATGPDPYANFLRDRAIAFAVQDVMRRTGLPATRNLATDDECACSAVTEALKKIGIHLSEAAVKKAWKRGLSQ